MRKGLWTYLHLGLMPLVFHAFSPYSMNMKIFKRILLTLLLGLYTTITFAQGQLAQVPQAIRGLGPASHQITQVVAAQAASRFVQGSKIPHRAGSLLPSQPRPTLVPFHPIITRPITKIPSAQASSPRSLPLYPKIKGNKPLHNKLVTIFHTSDTHGFFYPREGKGGYAALASLLNKQAPDTFLLLDSGDFANGSPETLTSKGISAVTMMNALHYNAATLGNHDFAFYNGDVDPLLENAKFTVLAANLYESDTLQHPPHVKPYKIFMCDGVKFAVIGLANANPLQENGKYIFTPPLQELEKILPEIEKQNPNVVIVVVHDSVEDNHHDLQDAYVAEIGNRFSGRVHIVLGGHAHNIFQNKRINDVLFVESGHSLQNVSKIVVEIDQNTGEIVHVTSELIPLVINKIGQDETIRSISEGLRKPGIDTPLGTAISSFEDRPLSQDQLDHPINNWVADLIREHSGADISLVNDTGTRLGLPSGDITERHLIEVYPFDDVIIKFPISGELLLEFAARTLGDFSFSGMDIIYTQDENGNRKIVSAQINGYPLDTDKSYTLAASSYLAREAFPEIPETLKQKVDSKTLHSLMRENLTTQQPVIPPDAGRIRRIP